MSTGANINEIIRWLQRVEAAAADAYGRAAEIFSNDSEFANLLQKLRDDEIEHGQVARSAAEMVASGVTLPCILTIEPSEMEYIEDFLVFLRNRIKAGKVTKDGLLHYMVTIESKECNDFMAYIANWQFKAGWVRKNAEDLISNHRKSVEEYLDTQRGKGVLLKRLDVASALRGKKLLVVSGDSLVEDGLRAIYAGEDVLLECAKDSNGALGRLGQEDYSAIVADADTAEFDIREFYSEAVGLRPQIKHRLVLFSGKEKADPKLLSSGLRYLSKPASVHDIRNALKEVAG